MDPAVFVDPELIEGELPQVPTVGVVPEDTNMPPLVTIKTEVPIVDETFKRKSVGLVAGVELTASNWTPVVTDESWRMFACSVALIVKGPFRVALELLSWNTEDPPNTPLLLYWTWPLDPPGVPPEAEGFTIWLARASAGSKTIRGIHLFMIACNRVAPKSEPSRFG